MTNTSYNYWAEAEAFELADRAAEQAYYDAEMEKQAQAEREGRGWDWDAAWGKQPADEHIRALRRTESTGPLNIGAAA